MDDQSKNHDIAYDVVCVALKTVQQPYTQHYVLVTTELNSLLAAEPTAMPFSHHITLSAHETMDVSSVRSFYILFSNASNCEARFLKFIILQRQQLLQTSRTQVTKTMKIFSL